MNGGAGGILHDNFAIFDARLVLTSSYNWSTAAEENNDENAEFIRNTSVTRAFQTNFNLMWSTPVNGRTADCFHDTDITASTLRSA